MNKKEVLVLIMFIDLFLIGISIVSATEIIINDNGITINGTYSDTSWTLATGQGYGNDVHYTSAGDGSQKAWWCPNITTAGNYNVSVSWTEYSNRATNAPYTVYYNSGSYPFTVDQTKLANGTIGPNIGEWSDWYNAGIFYFTTGTGCTDRNITLDNNANNFVIADAVKFEMAPSGSCTLTSSASWNFNYPTSTILTCSCSGDGTTHLYFDGILHDNYNDTSMIFAANPSGYSVVCNMTTGIIYNSATTSNTLTVNKAVPNFFASVTSPITYGTPSNYVASESNTGDDDCNYTLTRNSSLIYTGSSVSDNKVLAAGTYIYVYSTTGCTNYTSGEIDKTLVVNQANNPIDIYFVNLIGTFKNQNITVDPSTAITSNSTLVFPDSGSANLYEDGILVSNPITTTWSLGIHSYKGNSSGNVNYSSNSTGATYYVIVLLPKPISIINSPPTGSWHNVDFSVNVSDFANVGFAYCEYRVWSYNGTAWVNTRDWTNRTCNSPTSMIITVGLGKDCRDLGNNTCEVHVRAVDNANNTGNTDYRKFSIDWLGPSIVYLTPRENICVNNSRSTISANYYDLLTGINPASVKIIVNGVDVTSLATIISSKVTYTPTADLPDGINNVTVIANDTLGNSANKSWSFIVDTTKPVVIISSPVNSTIYSSRMIELNVSVNDTNAIKIEYSYDGIRFTPLCGLCNSYDRKMTFRDGNITLYIKAIDCAGNVGLSYVNFYVDTTPPKILKQYPLCRTCCDSSYTCTCKAPCSNGTFTVSYTEDNLKNITLFYKEILDADYQELTNTTCKSGTNQQCNFYVNLTNYDDGQYINYYFVIRDYVSETASKICTVQVESKLPNITITSPTNGTTYNSSMVLLNISVSKPVKLEYSDRGCEFRKLCDNCDSYKTLLPLKDGLHELQIRATDCSGNSVITTRVFTVKKKFFCFSFLGCK